MKASVCNLGTWMAGSSLRSAGNRSDRNLLPLATCLFAFSVVGGLLPAWFELPALDRVLGLAVRVQYVAGRRRGVKMLCSLVSFRGPQARPYDGTWRFGLRKDKTRILMIIIYQDPQWPFNGAPLALNIGYLGYIRG